MTPKERQSVGGGQQNADRAAVTATERKPDENARKHQEWLLDEAIEESFPASDPISPKRVTGR